MIGPFLKYLFCYVINFVIHRKVTIQMSLYISNRYNIETKNLKAIMSEQSQINYGLIHGTCMAVAWFGLTQVAVWATFFKQYYASLYIHIGLGIAIIFLVAFSSTLILTNQNFEYQWSQYGFHNGVGAILFYILPILIFSGTIAKFSKSEPIKPATVKKASYAHRIIGWIFIAASRAPLYTGFPGYTQFPTLFFIIFDVISYGLFWFLKLRSSKVHRTIEITPDSLRIIQNEKSLEIYGDNYFIYSNKVYPVQRLLHSHPGGFKLIDGIRGRQVDRFIYGGEFLEEFYQDSPHSHSTKSLQLPEEPIAEIKINPLYRSMGPLNSVQVQSISKLNQNTNICLLYLRAKNNPFQFEGYTSIEQLGRFYALNANNKITRLYSPVHFATRRNINLMTRLNQNLNVVTSNRNFLLTDKQQLMTELIPISAKTIVTQNCLPLMIKQYPQGRFTSKYLKEEKTQFMVSSPQGFGLSLASLNPGKIVMFSGGTGFYPFSDVIDLLYKTHILQIDQSYANQILNNDPILKKDPFKGFTFEIHCSLRNYEQIHPVSMIQMNTLSQNNKLKSFFKVGGDQAKAINASYKHIQIQNHRFEHVVKELIKSDDFSGILICGPGFMSKAIVDQLKQGHISKKRYRVL